MREIKFRAWDLINRHWCGYALRGFVLIDEGNKEQEIIQWEPKRDGKILMQYTGLKDKNGKEIYEGDIVIASNLIPSGNAIVTWDRNGYWVESIPDGQHSGLVGGGLDEVIGNIYENPELLTPSSNNSTKEKK